MNRDAPTALTADVFSGHRPTASGDLSVETHGIAPIVENQRYGRPGRMFTVWFAPQVTMTGVFTGTLAVALGLGFWLGMLAMTIGTVLGSLVVGYLSTWGPRTGTAQLPNSRMAFGGGVVLPAALQWLSSIAWDGLVGLFGGEALSVLLGIPFWVGGADRAGPAGRGRILRLRTHPPGAGGADGHAVRDVRGVRREVGHRPRGDHAGHGGRAGPGGRVRHGGHHRVQSGDLVGQLRRRLQPIPARGVVDRARCSATASPESSPRTCSSRASGSPPRTCSPTRPRPGVRSVMGGGVLGAIALLAIALASIGSSAMNDYSGSLALQTIGVRVRRPASAVVVTVLAFLLIMWLHPVTPRRGSRTCCCSSVTGSRRSSPSSSSTGYCGPRAAAASIPPLEHTDRADAVAAVVVFVRRLRRRDPVHEHLADPGVGRPGVARRRHRLFRELARRRRALRRLAVRAIPPGPQ